MGSRYQYLAFNVKVLKILNMWPGEKPGRVPKWKQWKSYYIFISGTPISVPVILESILVFTEDDIDIAIQLQSVLASVCILGMLYMVICFLQNGENIKTIIEDLDQFKKYSNLDIVAIDTRASLYSKMMLTYSVLGTLIYTSMPFTSIRYCEAHKSKSMIKYGIPCGMITRYRLPFRYDKSPIFEILVVHTMSVAGVTTVVVVTLTMLVYGLLIQVINQLKELRRNIYTVSKGDIAGNVRCIIEYHIAIIGYMNKVNKAFGSQLLLHITLTSFVISVLGFIILTVNNAADTVRFTMHLVGWFVLLYFVCHNGQLLIDESNGIAVDAYYSEWYTSSVRVQKDIRMIMMRAQRPLVLKALSIEIFSARTFLRIISSAYSYFTLLLHFKK